MQFQFSLRSLTLYTAAVGSLSVLSTLLLNDHFPDLQLTVRSFFIDQFSSKTSIVSEDELHGERKVPCLPFVRYSGRVSAICIDRNRHMNNARYLYETNFSRRHFFTVLGAWKVVRETGANMIIIAQSIRFRKELSFNDRYVIETRIKKWSDADSCFYIESRFVCPKTNFIHAIHYCKYRLVVPTLSSVCEPGVRLTPTNLLKKLDLIPPDYNHNEGLESVKGERSFLTCWEEGNKICSVELNPQKK